MKITQNDYLRFYAIAMTVVILLLTIFVSAWCLVSAVFAVLIIVITDYLNKPISNLKAN